MDEEWADAFLSTLLVGTNSKEEIREVTDQLFCNDEILLPPQTKPLDEHYNTFTDSQRLIKNNVEVKQTQTLSAMQLVMANLM